MIAITEKMISSNLFPSGTGELLPFIVQILPTTTQSGKWVSVIIGEPFTWKMNMQEHKMKIEYCVPCQFEKNAKRLAGEIEAQFAHGVKKVGLIASNQVGIFEVYFNQDLIFSKMQKGRLPHPGEIEQEIMKRLVL